MPLASVVPVVELNVPQSAAGVPFRVSTTGSDEIAAPATVTVTVEVLLPSAATLTGLVFKLIVLTAGGLEVCVTGAVALLPVPASVAVTKQNPIVVVDV